MPLLTYWNVFGVARDTSDLISMASFTFTMRRHLIRLASVPYTSFRLTKFGWVPFVVCNEAERKIYSGWVKSLVLFWIICELKFTKFSDDVGDTSYFITPDVRLSTARFLQKIGPSAIKSRSRRKKRTHVKVFGPQFFLGGMTPTFLRHIVSTIYCPPFGKVWLSSVCMSGHNVSSLSWNLIICIYID